MAALADQGAKEEQLQIRIERKQAEKDDKISAITSLATEIAGELGARMTASGFEATNNTDVSMVTISGVRMVHLASIMYRIGKDVGSESAPFLWVGLFAGTTKERGHGIEHVCIVGGRVPIGDQSIGLKSIGKRRLDETFTNDDVSRMFSDGLNTLRSK